MDDTKTALERAFELARSGTVPSVGDIKLKLKAEGYDQHQIEGFALAKQLRSIIAQARRTSDGPE